MLVLRCRKRFKHQSTSPCVAPDRVKVLQSVPQEGTSQSFTSDILERGLGIYSSRDASDAGNTLTVLDRLIKNTYYHPLIDKIQKKDHILD
ncbi:hypothetical protein QJS04_geneDACA004334 [Acorus gramineus]|uniref:Uncharacterized protein n=1 Tax=Acorus gramineus TaxID=55184 RepID=A0AAV9B376_ACOGR|nr:hypothetical protein QJS04_geneDACA004334 [Acorus gramineus]